VLESFELALLSPDGVRILVNASTTESTDGRVSLVLEKADVCSGVFTGYDAIDALRLLRRKVERLGWRVLCNGARRDAWASGMARDMSNGFRLYINLEHGKPARDVADTFDEAPSELIGTCEEQRAHYERWLAESAAQRMQQQ